LSETPGKAGWTWYTGSAAWLRRVALDWVLGVRASWEGLIIDPVPPAELGEVDYVRAWRASRVRVRFDAREFDPAGRATLVVNGTAAAGNVLESSGLEPGEVAHVEVRWSKDARVDAPRSAAATGVAT